MDKNEALFNLNGIGWLLIIIGILAIISKIIYMENIIFSLVIDVPFWAGISICGWFILSSRKALE